jgi:hypothetical protein
MLRLRSADVVWRELDGETVLLNLATSEYFQLNATGSVLIKLLAQGATEPALTVALAGTFGIAESQASDDVRAFLDHLRSHSLLIDTA